MAKDKNYQSPTYIRLLERIKASGKNQVEISQGSKVAQSTVGRIMRGEVYPHVDTYDRIMAYLDSLPKPKRARKPAQPVAGSVAA